MPRLPAFFRDSDEEYIQAIRTGGPHADRAIAAIYQKYRHKTLLEISKLTKHNTVYTGHPEDLLHDAFLVMLHKIECESTLQIHSISGFWIRIAKNRFLNEMKKDERMVALHEPETGYGPNASGPDDWLLRQEEKEHLDALFLQMGQRCREVLLMWAGRYTMKEIAQQLHLSGEVIARKIKYHCFTKLKELVRQGHKRPG